jgi:hypothetical protein
MEKLKLNEIQTYFDEISRDELTLWFGKHHLIVDGISISLEGIPLLRNERTGEIHFPDKTKYLVHFFAEEGKKSNQTSGSMKPRELGKKRYSYATKFDFLYSQIDYEFIPGLAREWDDGFLTPVFFNLSVLNKYTQNPGYRLDLFSESYGNIWKGDEWSIAFGINKGGKVIMWLGDLDELPDSEKYYLRSENTESDHDIHSEFYDAQIDVQWSDPSRQSALFRLRCDLSDKAKARAGIDIYMLEGVVDQVIANLHRPVFWDDKHVGPVIEALNRVFVESINAAEVKRDIKTLDPTADTKDKRGLKLFELWLSKRTDLKDIPKTMCPYYVLYDFRVLTCHLLSPETSEKSLIAINSRLGIPSENKDYERIYDALIDLLSASYKEIIDSLLGEPVASTPDEID